MPKTWREFFEARNDADYINPFWDDINSTLKNCDSESLSFDEIVELSNSRKLTGYLNREAPPKKRWQDYFANHEDKDFLEFQIVVDALDQLELKKDYFKLLEKIGWAPNLVTARHFFYLNFIKKRISAFKGKPLRILEIGGGGGTLSIFLRHYFNIEEYIDVDFAEMCLVNYAQHLRCFRKEKHSNVTFDFFNNSDNFHKIHQSGPKVLYLEPGMFFQKYRKLGKFDLILNTHSFQEMDQTIREKYCDICSSILAKDGQFFHVNTDQKMSNRDGVIRKNSPLTYKYPIFAEVCHLAEDPLLKTMRLRVNHKPVKLSYITVIKKKQNWKKQALLNFLR